MTDVLSLVEYELLSLQKPPSVYSLCVIDAQRALVCEQECVFLFDESGAGPTRRHTLLRADASCEVVSCLAKRVGELLFVFVSQVTRRAMHGRIPHAAGVLRESFIEQLVAPAGDAAAFAACAVRSRVQLDYVPFGMYACGAAAAIAVPGNDGCVHQYAISAAGPPAAEPNTLLSALDLFGACFVCVDIVDDVLLDGERVALVAAGASDGQLVTWVRPPLARDAARAGAGAAPSLARLRYTRMDGPVAALMFGRPALADGDAAAYRTAETYLVAGCAAGGAALFPACLDTLDVWLRMPLPRPYELSPVVAVAISDLDYDGRAEIALGTYAKHVWVFRLHRGADGALAATLLTLRAFARPVYALAVSDWNGDGVDELLALSRIALHVLQPDLDALVAALAGGAAPPPSHVAGE